MDRSQQINPFVQETEPKRHYIKVYLDFLDSSLLDLEEKGVYLCLKRFADFSLDSNGIVDKVYPKISDLVKITGKSKNCVGAILSSLDEKGAIEKIRQGLTKPNIYILSDREEMWYADSYDKMRMYARESDIERTTRILEDLKAGNVVDRSTRQRYEYDPYKVAQALSGSLLLSVRKTLLQSSLQNLQME